MISKHLKQWLGLALALTLCLTLCQGAFAQEAAYTPIDQLAREDGKLYMEDMDPAIRATLQAQRCNFDALKLRVLKERVNWISTLELNDPEQPLQDLSWLQIFDNLTSITIENAELTNISLIGDYAGLTQLTLYNSGSFDLSPLGNCTELTSLTLGYGADYAGTRGAMDLSVLSGMKKLTELNLYGDCFTDVSVLADLAKTLTTLTINGTAVTDFSPLAKLKKLTSLHIGGLNEADAVSLMTTFKKTIKTLLLSDMTLSEAVLDSVNDCSKVTKVSLTNVTASVDGFYDNLGKRVDTIVMKDVTLADGSTVGSLSSSASSLHAADAPASLVAHFLNEVSPKITTLELTTAEMPDTLVAAITDRSKLGELTLNFTADVSVSSSGWDNLKGLETVTITSAGKKIDDLAFVAKLPNCVVLTLQTADVTSAKDLAKAPKLYMLYIYACKIDDYGFLSKLNTRETINTVVIYGSGLDSVGFVKGMDALKTLYVDGNAITDLSPLASAPLLYKVSVIDNPIEDYTPLTKVKSLGLVMLDQGGVFTGSSIITKSENVDAIDYQTMYSEAFE